jgi:hypothetical protein
MLDIVGHHRQHVCDKISAEIFVMERREGDSPVRI